MRRSIDIGLRPTVLSISIAETIGSEFRSCLSRSLDDSRMVDDVGRILRPVCWEGLARQRAPGDPKHPPRWPDVVACDGAHLPTILGRTNHRADADADAAPALAPRIRP